MSTQKVMLYTKDNKIIVIDIDLTGYDETRKRLELQRIQHYFSQYFYKDICLNKFNNRHTKSDEEKKLLSLMDPANTSFVNKYVPSFNYAKNRHAYKNSVKQDNFHEPNVMHFAYGIDDSSVPEFVKNLGFNIVPQESTEEINVDDPNFEKDFDEQKTLMQVNAQNKQITIYRHHYKLPPADYVRLRRLITSYNSLSPRPDVEEYGAFMANDRDRKLFKIYSKETKLNQGKETFLHHEFHHIKNRMIFSGIMCKPDVKRLTAEDAYRLEVENEHSAYLSQTIECINRYLKGGDFNDYSMFDNFTSDLPEKLKTMTDSQKLSYLTDMDKIVNYAINRFEENKRKHYDKIQFKDSLQSSLLSQPMDVPEDLSGEQYRLMRSAYYSISVYNPATGKNEISNLSKFIRPEDEVKISTEEMQKIIDPAKEKLKDRLKEFEKDSQASGIDISLLDEARAFYRKTLRTPRIISEAQTINVADLVDGKPQIDEHTSPTASVPPTPVPDDKADWSDDLQKYWSKFEGYKEQAKNNAEYRFEINKQEVRYTSKTDVSLGKTCGYEMYDRLVKEPSGANKAIRFENTLSKEQALMLYVACINNGRRMRGAIPHDLSAIDTMTSIPQAERDKFKSLTTPPSASRVTASPRPLSRTAHTR